MKTVDKKLSLFYYRINRRLYLMGCNREQLLLNQNVKLIIYWMSIPIK